MLTAAEAARALGISLDTLRRWDRGGKIRVERDSANRRVVPVAEIERLSGSEGSEQLSARNRFRGVVRSVTVEGLLAQVEAVAIKRVLAYQIVGAMKQKKLTKVELAKLMGTSRAQLDRLLDPENPSVTLQSLGRAAFVLGKRLITEMDDKRKRKAA